MIHGDTALRQNFFQVAVGNAIPDIEENRVQDNVFRIVGTFKADLHSPATKIGGLSPKIRKFATEPLHSLATKLADYLQSLGYLRQNFIP
ncbi:hypothetical protein AADEFJLK_04232 [Methylovulum psychrotolerans]|uniref:Uncharacterized protein n=1 Tax=Methylovulum psychrotolerans TaxID=1704499 RepID=A0A2S5CGT5_9GAMM|nr:hypothetical protein AADEFJLK_04232 [Methylovulum psychrotolerans]